MTTPSHDNPTPTPTADLIARARRDADLLDARHSPTSAIAATLREAADAMEMLEGERDAVARLCFAPDETRSGHWYYRLLIDHEGESPTYADESRAVAAVLRLARRSAGLVATAEAGGTIEGFNTKGEGTP